MTERYNHNGRNCPRCNREGSLEIRAGLYDCLGCGARFKFIPATNDTVATLERVREDSPWNAGARMADDHSCNVCGRRGFVGTCNACASDLGKGR